MRWRRIQERGREARLHQQPDDGDRSRPADRQTMASTTRRTWTPRTVAAADYKPPASARQDSISPSARVNKAARETSRGRTFALHPTLSSTTFDLTPAGPEEPILSRWSICSRRTGRHLRQGADPLRLSGQCHPVSHLCGDARRRQVQQLRKSGRICRMRLTWSGLPYAHWEQISAARTEGARLPPGRALNSAGQPPDRRSSHLKGSSSVPTASTRGNNRRGGAGKPTCSPT